MKRRWDRRSMNLGLLSLILGACRRRPNPNAKRSPKLSHEPWVLWPEGQPPEGGWPLLAFLHGMGEVAWKAERPEDEGLEQSRDVLLTDYSPVTLHRNKNPRVPTLWQRFALVAPQAFNPNGIALYWDWTDVGVRAAAVAAIERVVQSGRVNAERVAGVGFSRGGQGCLGFDAAEGATRFRKIATVDAQGLDGLSAVVQRGREVRAYYTPSTYSVIREAHVAAEQVYGKATPPVSLIARSHPGRDYEAHTLLAREVFAEDELYQWLLA
jgi:hypothetical protein